MRISIKRHNRPYFEQIAAQMECDYSEALNYLLMELKRVNYSFGSQVNLGINVSSVLPEKPVEPGQMVMSGLAYIADSDPVIEHLMSVGLEEF